MSWDPTWEQVYTRRDWGRYPPEELIRFVARNYFRVSDRGQVRILELGCGFGANLWFLAREGFDAYGIDGSRTAIAKAAQRLQEDGLRANLLVGDVVSLTELYPPEYFDAVVDVACLQHNRMRAVETAFDETLAVLKPRGRVFAMMLAAGSYGDGLGQEIEPRTLVDVSEGPLRGTGLCHLFTLEEIRQLLGRFADVEIECSLRSVSNQRQWYKHWVVEGAKS